jgi:hypothetical protein
MSKSKNVKPKKVEIISKEELEPKTTKVKDKGSVRIFEAEVIKGHIPKTTFDALASLNTITLRISKNGILIRDSDDTEDVRFAHVLWDVNWARKGFGSFTYKLKTETCVTLKSTHLQKMLKNVRKKDSLTFFIDKKNVDLLGITIKPTGNQTSSAAPRSETVYISIKYVQAPDVILPEQYLDENGDTQNAYGNPMIIGAADFQKIKKMSSVVRTIEVTIQKSNYISFIAGDEKIMKSDLEFGKLITTKDDISSSDDSSEEEGEKSQDENSSDDGIPAIYKKIFTMSLFNGLTKLPSLTSRMEFYAPKVENFPLKVSMRDTAGLGEITVFIKDQSQIQKDDIKKTSK